MCDAPLCGRFALVSIGVLMATAAAAPAQHNLMFSTLPGHPSAQVPGLVGAEFTAFRRPIRSASGLRWGMLADTTAGAVLIIDQGDGFGPQVVLQEGQPAPWAPPASLETVGDSTFDRNLMIRDDGQFIFTNNTVGGDSGSDEYVVLFNGTGFVAVAQEGQPVPASAGLPAGVTYGSTLDSPQIDTLGRIGFRATLNGIDSSMNTVLFFDGQVVAQEGVTVPPGQIAGQTETMRDVTSRSYYRSADGSAWIANARLNGDLSQDRMVMVNGAVVAQEGVTLPGLAAPIGPPASGFQGINDVQMMTGGDWFARGGNTDGVGWVMRNGTLAAQSFEPITPGATENWDPFLFLFTFFTSIGNDAGDYILGGTTDTFPIDFGGVMVLNGEHVVVRSFDPIDLNGNGMADDDYFLNSFFFDDAFLNDEGDLVVKVQTRDAAGNTLGEAVLDLDVSDLIGGACLCETDGDDAQVDVFDLLAYLSLWFAQDAAADIDVTPGVDVFDLLEFLSCWFPASAGAPCP